MPASTLSNQELNGTLLGLSKRAEAVDRKTLVTTFVDVGPLFTLLSSRDHQVIYGRRGTGKTHALQYLAEAREDSGDVVIYIDLRTLGSTGGLYSDSRKPLAERATRLLQDLLNEVHGGLLEVATAEGSTLDLSRLSEPLDGLADEIARVEVVGDSSRTTRTAVQAGDSAAETAGFGIGTKGVGFRGSICRSDQRSYEAEAELSVSGSQIHRVHFGAVTGMLRRIQESLGDRHVWLLLDEWSVINTDLQPYLADMVRRSIFPLRGITVKIGAIEPRTRFRISGKGGDYVGIELGADASADLNLDDYMVFDNDQERAKGFFKKFLFKHFVSVAPDQLREAYPTADHLVNGLFTQYPVFDEFVRATEGVPRDAINIMSLAAQRAGGAAIAIEHIRTAARLWYQRDKEAPVRSNSEAYDLLNWIIEEVIAHRKARAFLKRVGEPIELVEDLFDARVLHILKHNVSSHDNPGVRYDVYKIDYGCYVDLLTTNRAPVGLLPLEGEGESARYVDVPPDDYRAIRRAILDFAAYAERRAAN